MKIKSWLGGVVVAAFLIWSVTSWGSFEPTLRSLGFAFFIGWWTLDNRLEKMGQKISYMERQIERLVDREG